MKKNWLQNTKNFRAVLRRRMVKKRAFGDGHKSVNCFDYKIYLPDGRFYREYNYN